MKSEKKKRKCDHDNVIETKMQKCHTCGSEELCKHRGKRYKCQVCGKASMCAHLRQASSCGKCYGGKSIAKNEFMFGEEQALIETAIEESNFAQSKAGVLCEHTLQSSSFGMNSDDQDPKFQCKECKEIKQTAVLLLALSK
jgi:predicted RNA-binding Zn-ribbon protein involved in translation (DUF1610 family)